MSFGEVKCKICEKELTEEQIKRSLRNIGKLPKYCSTKCMGIGNRKKYKNTEKIRCVVCNKLLTGKQIKKAKHGNRIPKYCSTKCWGKRERTFEYDDKFLNEMTPFAAYFLGFFVADGHLGEIQEGCDKAGSVIFSGIKDKNIIDQLVEKTNYKKTIGEYYREDCTTPEYTITYAGDVSQKIQDMGFTNDKTTTVFIPNCITNELFPHFLRGVIDGDGWIREKITKYKDIEYNYLNIGICCSYKKFLENIWKILQNNKIVKGGFIGKDTSNNRIVPLYSLNFYHEDSILIGNYIYKNCDIKLNRKFEAYQQLKDKELKKHIQKGITCTILDCNAPARSKNLCKKHYDQQYGPKYYHKNKEKVDTYQKQWKADNPEKVKEYSRKSSKKNQDKRVESNRQWRLDNPEKYKEQMKKYNSDPEYKKRKNEARQQERKENPEKYRDYDNKRYNEKKEEINVQRRANYKKNKEACLDYATEYREKNREEIRKKDRERYQKNKKEVTRKLREKRAAKKKSS